MGNAPKQILILLVLLLLILFVILIFIVLFLSCASRLPTRQWKIVRPLVGFVRVSVPTLKFDRCLCVDLPGFGYVW
jgi:hypothetical protein